jgi:hypothetical protein
MVHRTYARNSRFFALLALFFQLVDVQVPPEETQTIVEDYLTVLEVLFSALSSS